MAQIPTNLFKDWKDNDVVKAQDYKLERETFRQSNNDLDNSINALNIRVTANENSGATNAVAISNLQNDKTDKTGNHLGKWQGLNPTDLSGATQALDLADVKNRVTALENRPTITGASSVTISDAGNYFSGTEVEAALQEIGSAIATNRGQLITSVNNILGL